MSPVALAECLGDLLLRLCISLLVLLVLSGVFFFFNKCKWRYGLTVEEEKSSFNVIKHCGLLTPTSPNHVLFHIILLESNPYPTIDPVRECLAHTLHGPGTTNK